MSGNKLKLNRILVITQRSKPSNPMEYLLYYEQKPNVRRPAAVLSGTDWTQINYDSQEIGKYVGSDGIISVNLNNGQQEIESHLTQVKHSKDLLIIHSKQIDSVIYIYGEKGDGLRVCSKSLIKICGILLIIRNGEIYVLEGGRHTIEPSSGDLKFIICDQNRILLIGSNFHIDDESYLDTNPKQSSQ